MAIEDAVSLVEALTRLTRPSELYRVLKAWETIRRPRIAFMVEHVRDLCHLFHLEDGPEQEARDLLWRTASRGSKKSDHLDSQRESPRNYVGPHMDDPPLNVRDPSWMPYIAGHDALAFVGSEIPAYI